jgi:Asp-tRNA(Asn)/Glu-tRNA(Gln) amidotransferase A subunit family amidase
MHTVAEIARALRARECSAVELARERLAVLNDLSTRIGAVAATDPERTIDAARAADERLRVGTARPLEGIPRAGRLAPPSSGGER